MSWHLRGAIVPLLIAAGAFIACGGEDEGGETSDRASPSASATAASGSPAGNEEVRTSTFQIALSLTAPAGFEVVADGANEFALERAEGGREQEAYLAFFIPTGVFNPDSTQKEELPPDLGQWLATNEELEILADPKPVEIGGYQGTQLDARGANPGAPALLLALPNDDHFDLPPNEPARFVVFNVEGTPLVIAGGPFNRAFFDEVKPELDMMIASVRFQ